jgi:hypothetical protein
MTKKIPKVFRIYHTEEVEYLLPVNDADYEYSTFDGEPRAATWTPIRMKHVREGSRGEKWVSGDFPAGGMGDLILNYRAKDRVGMILERYGELLPLMCEEQEYWTLNVTCFIDALDESKSVVLRATDEDRILLIDKYAFRSEALENAMLFKLPQLRRGAFLVSEAFVELIKSSGLTGLAFKQIWAPN